MLVYISYTVGGMIKFGNDHVWFLSPELPWWGSIVVILASVGAAATPSIPRIVWATGVVAAAFVVVANAAESRMIEMATTATQAWLLAAAEVLLVFPLFYFSVIVPKPKQRRA